MSSISALNFTSATSQMQLRALVQSLPVQAPQRGGKGEDSPQVNTGSEFALAVLSDAYKLQSMGAEGVKSLTVGQVSSGPDGEASVSNIRIGGGQDAGMTKAQVKAKLAGPTKVQVQVASAPAPAAAPAKPSVAKKPMSFGKPSEKAPVVKVAVNSRGRELSEGK